MLCLGVGWRVKVVDDIGFPRWPRGEQNIIYLLLVHSRYSSRVLGRHGEWEFPMLKDPCCGQVRHLKGESACVSHTKPCTSKVPRYLLHYLSCTSARSAVSPMCEECELCKWRSIVMGAPQGASLVWSQLQWGPSVQASQG